LGFFTRRHQLAIILLVTIINLKKAEVMKKLILAVVAVATLSITSCKKEEAATPSLKSKTVADQKDNGNWD
jgi:hypothetical protein